MVLILELIRRDRLQERYSVVWFVAGLGMLAGAAFPGLLELVADVMGVRDTNVALFSIVLLLLLGLALNFSVIMSRQAAQITRLAQERALEKAREQAAGRARNGDGVTGEQALEPEEERLEGQLLGDVEVEAAAGVLDQLGGAAGAAGSRPSAWARSCVEAVAVEDDLLGAGGDRGEVAEPGGAELEAEVEDLGAAAAAGAFRLVGDVAGGALDPGLRSPPRAPRGSPLRPPRRPPRRARAAPSRAPSATSPASAAATQRSASARSSRPALAEQQPGPLEVAGGEARGGGDLLRSGVAPSPAQLGFERLGRQRREVDRLAARGDRLQQRLRLGAEQDQVDELGRLLERLQQRVLALVAHRLGRLDDEDPLAAFEGPVGGGADHPLAHLLDHVLGAASAPARRGRDGARGRAGPGGARPRGRRRRRRGSRPRRRAPRRACRPRAGRGRGRRARGPTRAPRSAPPAPAPGARSPRRARRLRPSGQLGALTRRASITRSWTSSTLPVGVDRRRPGRRRSCAISS